MSGYDLLISRLKKWRLWYRLNQGVYWGLHGTLAGTLASVILTSFAITTNNLLASSYLFLLLSAGLAGMTIASLFAFLRPLSLWKMARLYEGSFNLKERISTAIELHTDELISESWREMQLSDALKASAQLSPRAGLDWRVPRIEIIAALMILAIAVGAWFYGQGSFAQAEINLQNQELIEAQVGELEEIISKMENDDQLSAEEIAKLLAPLQASLEELKQADTLEEAVSVLSEAQRAMDEMSEPGKRASQSLQEAEKSLAEAEDGSRSPFGEELSEGNFSEAAQSLDEMDLGALNEEALESLAKELEQAAEALQNASPELAEQLQKAAQEIQNDDLQAAQQALEGASEEMLEVLQNMEFSEASAQSAEALGTSKEELLEAANAASPLENAQQAEGQNASGAGEGESVEDASKEEVGLNPIDQGNSPDGGGESEYDSVYAPERLGGDPASASELTPSGEVGENMLGETPGSSERAEQSFVPYYEVFPEYEASVRQSLQSGTIPLALRPLIRDYFSSLAP